MDPSELGEHMHTELLCPFGIISYDSYDVSIVLCHYCPVRKHTPRDCSYDSSCKKGFRSHTPAQQSIRGIDFPSAPSTLISMHSICEDRAISVPPANRYCPLFWASIQSCRIISPAYYHDGRSYNCVWSGCHISSVYTA